MSDANVSYADSGDTICFRGLAFQPRGGQVTTDYFETEGATTSDRPNTAPAASRASTCTNFGVFGTRS